MPLTPGTRLGVYEITAPIGEGGMGQVFRATDTKLKRQVAIKILPPALAADVDRLARFQREAEVLASLNHPNIAAIYGLEESAGTTALVMELVEGEDLTERIATGAVPLDQALPIAKQIAEALGAAHEQGIIHRDLKPANIKVRADGTVKVLDFGLAKAMEPPAGSSPGLSISPTITSPAMTQAGMILGTAAYMSPEQARGKAVDKRADIWAFGCVFFEMLTGRKAFDPGETVSDAIAAILTREPDLAALPAATPPAVRRLIKRSLTKDPRERLHDIGDARLDLADTSEIDTQRSSAARPSAPRSVIPAVAAAVIAASVVTAAGTWAFTRTLVRVATARGATRFAIDLPTDQALSGISLLDMSPDGRAIVYVANDRLYLRRLDQLAATLIGNVADVPDAPTFSPDGQWVAYGSRVINAYQIKKVPIAGGAPTKICDVGFVLSGLRWVGDRILFTQAATPFGISEVSANGGTPRVIVAPGDNEIMSNPDALPDGDTVLFTLRLSTQRGASSIVAQSLKSGARHVVVADGSLGRVLGSGQILFTRDATLYAQPINLTTLETDRSPVAVGPGLVTNASYPYGVSFAVSADGSIAYVPPSVQLRRLVWLDRRDGREEPISAEPMAYIYPTISPDATRLALNVHDDRYSSSYSIWTWNFQTSTLNRITLDKKDVRYAIWTSDGKRLIFSQSVPGGRQLMWANADGSGSGEAVSQVLENQFPMAAPLDGKSLIFRSGPSGNFTFAVQSLEGDRSERHPLIARPGEFIANAEISSDGRWIAYQSGSADTSQVYVQPFPNVQGGRWLVSTHGGSRPLWARSGRELFYLTPDGSHIEAVPITPGSAFTFGRAQDVLDVRRFVTSFQGGSGDAGRTYDVSPDGQRFLVMASANDATQQIVVVEHWLDEFAAGK